jgi:hypothetical protein
MSTTQKLSLAAGLLIFLALGIAATATGRGNLSSAWMKAGLAGVVVYALTAFGIGVAQGASQARRDQQQPPPPK